MVTGLELEGLEQARMCLLLVREVVIYGTLRTYKVPHLARPRSSYSDGGMTQTARRAPRLDRRKVKGHIMQRGQDSLHLG